MYSKEMQMQQQLRIFHKGVEDPFYRSMHPSQKVPLRLQLSMQQQMKELPLPASYSAISQNFTKPHFKSSISEI